MISGPEMWKTLASALLATARVRRVLPVPGGPSAKDLILGRAVDCMLEGSRDRWRFRSLFPFKLPACPFPQADPAPGLFLAMTLRFLPGPTAGQRLAVARARFEVADVATGIVL